MSLEDSTVEALLLEEQSRGVLINEQIEHLLKEAETRLRNISDSSPQDVEAQESQDVIAIGTVTKRKQYVLPSFKMASLLTY